VSLSDGLKRISEDQDVSISNLSDLQQSIQLSHAVEKKRVRFVDEVELNEISKLRRSVLDDVFYGSEEIATFRYEAFMGKAV